MFCRQQLSPLSSRNRHFGDDAHPLHKVSWKLTMTTIITKKRYQRTVRMIIIAISLVFVSPPLSINQNHEIIVTEKNLNKSWNHSNHTVTTVISVIICFLFMFADQQCWHHPQTASGTFTTARSSSGSAAGRPGTESKVQVFLGGRPSLRKVSKTACHSFVISSPSCSDALENRIFRREHSHVHEVRAVGCRLSCQDVWGPDQRNFAAKGMTTNHKISRRCHSSVGEPWIEIVKSTRALSFQLFVTRQTQHQATSPRRPWHRIPSYEVKNLSGQIEQLAGQYYVSNWRPKKNASEMSEFVWQWMEPGVLTSRLWSDFRCSQLLSLFQLPNHQLQNYPRRLKTYDALVIRFALKFGSNCVSLDICFNLDFWCLMLGQGTCGRSSMSTMVEL